MTFSPGLTGGVLMMALFLSAIGKTGPIMWSMSGPANQLLRQLGLLLFLAEVGTSAGKTLVATSRKVVFCFSESERWLHWYPCCWLL